MFERFRNLFRPQAEPAMLDADLIGDDLDMALDTYSELLDNNCRDLQILEIARERIMDLQLRYQAAKRDELEGMM
jgi:hypothetical protein